MTAQLFRELLESLDDDVETLGMEEVMTEGEDCLTRLNAPPSLASNRPWTRLESLFAKN